MTTANPTVPDFDLLRPIGRGGFGEVWLGVNRSTGALRAVKLIPLRGVAADPAGREMVSLAQLESQRGARHPHLLDIQHVGRTESHLFYLMDLADDVSGRPASDSPEYRPATLARRLELGGLSAADALRCARQLLAGLAHLHEAGMVHRDVKPANCLFVGRDLKLADFGLLTAASTHLSRLGTLKYMPPDGRMDLRADVYAAGLVLYEMLSGLPADSFPRLGERAREIASDPTLAQLNRVALRAAQRDHHLRYAHAGEMRDELERIAAKAPSKRQLDPRQRRRWRIAAAATTLPLLAALLAAPLLRERFLSNPDSASETEGAANSLRSLAGSQPTPSSPSALSPTASSPTGVKPAATNSPAASVQLDATPVEVNFVSNTFEAEIYLDDQLLRGPDGRPLKTPCTAWRIAPTPRRVRLVHPVKGEIDLGEIDFAKVREVVARW
ncbi:MAG: serine/threonine-protein kinase [Pirellulales bacterium]